MKNLILYICLFSINIFLWFVIIFSISNLIKLLGGK